MQSVHTLFRLSSESLPTSRKYRLGRPWVSRHKKSGAESAHWPLENDMRCDSATATQSHERDLQSCMYSPQDVVRLVAESPKGRFFGGMV